jgi:hypothetical protein
VIDPGQKEGLNPEPEVKRHEPPSGSERFNEVYYNWKESERKEEAGNKKLEEMAKEMESLRAQIGKTVTTQAPQEEPPHPTEIDVELASLKVERKQAIKDVDTDRQIEIQDKIDALMEKKFSQKPAPPVDIESIVQKTKMEDAAARFQDENKWFSPDPLIGAANPDYDQMKSGAAMELERGLGKTWTGSYNALLKEVAKQVNERFETKRPKVSAVASVSSTTKQPRKVIELNDLQRQAAKGFFSGDPDAEEKYKELISKQKGAK